MCNKQSFTSKYNLIKLKKQYSVLFIIVLLCISGCREQTIYKHDFSSKEYQNYEEAVQEKSLQKLYDLTYSEDRVIERLAWNSISKFRELNGEEHVERVIENDQDFAWFALSRMSITDSLYEELNDLWQKNSINRDYSCEVFGRVVDINFIPVLLNEENFLKNSSACALTVGRITARRQIPEEQIKKIIELAFETKDSLVRRNLLYGFYRNRINNIRKQPENLNILLSNWREVGLGSDYFLDQMIVRIGAEPAIDLAALKIMNNGYRDYHPIFIEILNTMNELGLDFPRTDFTMLFLRNPNYHVRANTINLLKTKNDFSEVVLNYIENEITGPTRNMALFLNSLELLSDNNRDISPYYEKLDFADKNHPELFNYVSGIYYNELPDDRYSEMILERSKGDQMDALLALRTLSQLIRANWNQLDQDFIDETKQIVNSKIERNSALFAASLDFFLIEEKLYSDSEIVQLYESFKDKDVSDWREYNQLFARVFIRRLGEDSKEILAEIAQKNDVRINHYLKNIGVDVPESENKFLPVNWDRLSALGKHPHWILETEKGIIEVKLDPLTAPFSVSAIDKLTTSGKLDNVPFHRVIANFVVQGGDYLLGNGVGSTEFMLPTEPSTFSFERNVVGIASQGRDTEGSQYFFTKQWSPHLDGAYTIVGTVVRGMDIVDRLYYGDKVLQAKISPR